MVTETMTIGSGATATLIAASRAVNAVKIYGSGEAAVRALDGINVDFQSGTFSAIMGPSGSGKSTLMHCLAGLDSLTSGEVWLKDQVLGTLSEKDLTLVRRNSIGFVFQSFNLVPTLTAAENLTLPLALAGHKPDPAWFDRVVDSLELRNRLSHRPAELSGGQQQRVAVGRALMSKPAVIFADEPTGNLDSRSGAEVLGFLKEAVKELGQSVVMVTHDANAASYADRVVFLADGKVVGDLESPNPEKIFEKISQLGD